MEMRRYRTKDGHEVRSRAEVIIDNTLFDLNIRHEYEKELRLGGRTYKPDWHLTDYNLYIEFWGMENNKSYQIYQREKQKVYGEYHIPYLSLADKDLEDRFELENRIVKFIERYQDYEIDYQIETIGILELTKLEKLPRIFFLYPVLYSLISGIVGASLILLEIIPVSEELNTSLAFFLSLLGI